MGSTIIRSSESAAGTSVFQISVCARLSSYLSYGNFVSSGCNLFTHFGFLLRCYCAASTWKIRTADMWGGRFEVQYVMLLFVFLPLSLYREWLCQCVPMIFLRCANLSAYCYIGASFADLWDICALKLRQLLVLCFTLRGLRIMCRMAAVFIFHLWRNTKNAKRPGSVYYFQERG